LIFSASKENIKNLAGNFGAIHVGIMCTKFQPSSFNGVGGGGDRQKDGQGTSCHIANFPPRFPWVGQIDFLKSG